MHVFFDYPTHGPVGEVRAKSRNRHLGEKRCCTNLQVGCPNSFCPSGHFMEEIVYLTRRQLILKDTLITKKLKQ
jgi:hypothetical protein